MKTRIDFTRINNDVNGNPRYVCHYTDLLKDDENGYDTALKNAKQFGGRKFHNKQYGGGIAFTHYNITDLGRKIEQFTGTFKAFGVMVGSEEMFSSDDLLTCEAWKNSLQPETLRNMARVEEF